ncbi:uncharacterized protein [Epargyreus clarus]|uniref:uncharacterized protein n=1 Tax=Epargyreus clarus TaxID=520877 RepID=UPI003C2B53AD
MKLLYFSLVVLLCVVIEINSERTRSGECNGCDSKGYTRIKRAKYYSSPPLRFYKRPPMSYPIRGAFSYTPPPGYMVDDDEQPSPNRPKVSKRPTTGGLGDEDINNIVKYLSKQDLDKIIEFANEKERETPKYNRESYERPNYINTRPDVKPYESRIINKDITPEVDNGNKFSLNGPYISAQEGFRPYEDEYNNPNEMYLSKEDQKALKFLEQEPTALFINKQKLYSNTLLDSDVSTQNHKFSFPNAFSYEQRNEIFNRTSGSIFTDSSIMQEEQLPLPSNLRERDYDASFTNNVLTVVKADSDSYKVENLAELPLMNYNSKLDTVDSYKVPHYTLTSSSDVKGPPVEPAPPASSARDQSDAHLKAIKIWTHKSKGTAYTLHDDGTLSLERPTRSKTYYDHP